MSQTAKLAESTIQRDKCFLKHPNATKKNNILGIIPHNAPVQYLVIRSKLPGLSTQSQTSTIRPVSGITPIRPASVGSLRPICVQNTMTATLMTSLIKKRAIFLPSTRTCPSARTNYAAPKLLPTRPCVKGRPFT